MVWVANDELGDLHAEAKALGADVIVLKTQRRTEKFVETKRIKGSIYYFLLRNISMYQIFLISNLFSLRFYAIWQTEQNTQQHQVKINN
jgi:hypothetical protein